MVMLNNQRVHVITMLYMFFSITAWCFEILFYIYVYSQILSILSRIMMIPINQYVSGEATNRYWGFHGDIRIYQDIHQRSNRDSNR